MAVKYLHKQIPLSHAVSHCDQTTSLIFIVLIERRRAAEIKYHTFKPDWSQIKKSESGTRKGHTTFVFPTTRTHFASKVCSLFATACLAYVLPRVVLCNNSVLFPQNVPWHTVWEPTSKSSLSDHLLNINPLNVQTFGPGLILSLFKKLSDCL